VAHVVKLVFNFDKLLVKKRFPYLRQAKLFAGPIEDLVKCLQVSRHKIWPLVVMLVRTNNSLVIQERGLKRVLECAHDILHIENKHL
jgi:hypothetical protein